MSTSMDNYALDTVRRRGAELEAQIDVLDAQQKLRLIYMSELDEINAFLASVEAAQSFE